MKFSKKTRYGIAALIDLAENGKTGLVSIGNISERNNISQQYLEQIFSALKKGKLVKSVKGPQGGYSLNQRPDRITLAMILNALEGDYHLASEMEDSESPLAIRLSIQETLIDEINRRRDEFLQNITLQELIESYEKHLEYDNSMYYI